jgi:intracellular sulfur oxidation DsrE/DsrF family protein
MRTGRKPYSRRLKGVHFRICSRSMNTNTVTTEQRQHFRICSRSMNTNTVTTEQRQQRLKITM